MDFAFTYEQDFLDTTARQMAAESFGSSVARAAVDGDVRSVERGWQVLVDTGWLGLRVPAAAGGSGAGLVEACIVADALAWALAPVPYVGSAIAAPALIGATGGDGMSLLAELANGRTLGVALSADLTWPTTSPAIGWECSSRGEALVNTPDGVEVVACDPLSDSADPLHPLATIPAGVAAVVTDAPETALAAMRLGCAAALLGTLRGAAELAFRYVKDRKQYGKTIGSFQAVQHMCADVQVALESCHSVVYGAAWTVDHGLADEAAMAAAVAKAWCAESAVTGVELVVQLLGGIGVTWESDAHLYLRQAHLYAGVLGSRRSVRAELGRSLLRNVEASHGSS
jgi:alkylation response protein AidB-like acyl-CoA dehydrogenase